MLPHRPPRENRLWAFLARAGLRNRWPRRSGARVLANFRKGLKETSMPVLCRHARGPHTHARFTRHFRG